MAARTLVESDPEVVGGGPNKCPFLASRNRASADSDGGTDRAKGANARQTRLHIFDDGMVVEVDKHASRLIGTRCPSMLHVRRESDQTIGNTFTFRTIFKKRVAIIRVDIVHGRVGIF